MALLAIGVTAILVLDLIRNLRTVVISEANRALTTAAKELVQVGSPRINHHRAGSPSVERFDQELKSVSYEILRSYPDVEGGFLWNEAVIGHSFPTYTEPGSTLRQPPLEHQEVLSALAESRRTGRIATRLAQDQNDLILVAVLAHGRSPLAAWSLRRIFNFSNSSELNKRVVLVTVMLVALVAIGIVLKLSFSLQQGFAMVQSGLGRLRTDLNYRLPDQDHELRSIVRAVNTMAESRQGLEAALRREDRLRVMGRVVAGIAHEIRNPLNSIRLTIRVLARRLHRQPEAAESIQLVIGEIDRLDTLLKSLLAFRPDEPPQIRRQPLQPILDRTLALVKPHASESGVAIHVNGVVDSQAAVDSDFLQQALMNLLLNAIDASGRTGTVEVTLQPANSHLVILIEDTGPGLTVEQQDRLFEAFYTTKRGGTGLGLAVTKTLLDNMGAGIDYSAATRGARFRVVLPAGDSA
jgi:signal transduction histidine kinase